MKTLQLICLLLVFSGTIFAQVDTAVEQRLDPTSILGKWIPIDPSDNNNPRWSRGINWMHFLPNNKVEWSFKGIGPASKPEIRRGSYTLMLSGNIVHYSTKRVLLRIDPTPCSPAIGGIREDGTPIFLMDLKVGKGIDCRFPYEAELLKFRTDVSDFAFTKDKSEQDGTGQPATRPESKSEGSDKPQPESEGRSW